MRPHFGHRQSCQRSGELLSTLYRPLYETSLQAIEQYFWIFLFVENSFPQPRHSFSITPPCSIFEIAASPLTRLFEFRRRQSFRFSPLVYHFRYARQPPARVRKPCLKVKAICPRPENIAEFITRFVVRLESVVLAVCAYFFGVYHWLFVFIFLNFAPAALPFFAFQANRLFSVFAHKLSAAKARTAGAGACFHF